PCERRRVHAVTARLLRHLWPDCGRCGDLLWIDRHPPAVLPLDDRQLRIHATTLLVELQMMAWEEQRRPVAHIQAADRLRHLVAVSNAGTLQRLLEDQHVHVGE